VTDYGRDLPPGRWERHQAAKLPVLAGYRAAPAR
jgi:hypothetical protein